MKVPAYTFYIARVPVTPEGLCLSITEINGVPCFNGYRHLSDGKKSAVMCMKPQPFRRRGDEIVAIDNKPIEGIEYDKVIKTLRENGGKQFRILRMRTKTSS